MRARTPAAGTRAEEVAHAHTLVVSDPAILSGDPVFAGTRVPVDVVLASLEVGVDFERLRAAYPFLTVAHLQAARVYREIHPHRSRPRPLSEVLPVRRRRIVRAVQR